MSPEIAETLRSCSAAPSARCSKATTRSLRRLKASSSRIIRSSISWPHEGSACGTAALTGTPGTATGTNASARSEPSPEGSGNGSATSSADTEEGNASDGSSTAPSGAASACRERPSSAFEPSSPSGETSMGASIAGSGATGEGPTCGASATGASPNSNSRSSAYGLSEGFRDGGFLNFEVHLGKRLIHGAGG